jgi:pimeloyl-ACP methyl ester carboxylesterase
VVPIPELVDSNTTMNLDAAGLSADPFYLDCIESDPLAFTSADTRCLTRELDRGWDRFGAELPKLTVPTLAVHGAIDPIAVPGAVRAYAEQIGPLEYLEFAGTCHDVLNDITHREVTAAIVDFIDRKAAAG